MEVLFIAMFIVGILNLMISSVGMMLRHSGNPSAPSYLLVLGNTVMGVVLVIVSVVLISVSVPS